MSLDDFDIKKTEASNCNCGKNSFIYRLPIRVDAKILPFMKKFGKIATDFNRHSLLRIENDNLSITAIKRLKEVKVSFKRAINLEDFESALIEYIKEQKGKK